MSPNRCYLCLKSIHAGGGGGGDLSVDGEVASGLLGADWTRGRWTTGLLVAHSLGEGGYRAAGGPRIGVRDRRHGDLDADRGVAPGCAMR